MSNDMRSLINLMENEGIKGNVDIRSILSLLREVDNPTLFMSAFNKLKRGAQDQITRQEMTQFALAFVSLIKEPKEDKMAVIRKLALVSDPTAVKGA